MVDSQIHDEQYGFHHSQRQDFRAGRLGRRQRRLCLRHRLLRAFRSHTQRGHIARATLEAVCFQTKAILDAMEKDSGHALRDLAVDGGMSNSNLCMQTQANIIGIPVDRPAMRETTALGAAIAAGFAVDIWKEFNELKAINQKDRSIFKPDIEAEDSEKMFKKWNRAVQMCKGWLDPEENEEEF
nr:glycerol kinase [Quercus suber]